MLLLLRIIRRSSLDIKFIQFAVTFIYVSYYVLFIMKTLCSMIVRSIFCTDEAKFTDNRYSCPNVQTINSKLEAIL